MAPLCRLRRLSLCSRCWRHIWLCWIVSRLQDPASLTISDAMKAMFVAMVCTKLADLYGILGNISAVCHTCHWKQHSPEFQLCILHWVSRAKELLLPIVFNSWHLAIQKQTNTYIYMYIIYIISIYLYIIYLLLSLVSDDVLCQDADHSDFCPNRWARVSVLLAGRETMSSSSCSRGKLNCPVVSCMCHALYWSSFSTSCPCCLFAFKRMMTAMRSEW